jgi:hypothetical protein
VWAWDTGEREKIVEQMRERRDVMRGRRDVRDELAGSKGICGEEGRYPGPLPSVYWKGGPLTNE